MSRLIIIFTALALFFANNVFATKNFVPSLQSVEHITVGDQVKLTFSKYDTSVHNNLLLENGLLLSYGQVLAFGDFYGNPDAPISEGQTIDERMARFKAAFASFSKEKSSIPDTKKVLAAILQERRLLEAGLKTGEKPEAVYRRITGTLHREYNCATGGSCGILWFLFPGRYLKLASNDVDHFGNGAVRSYEAGHLSALLMAISAHDKKDIKRLTEAYAMNAFASHYLSDLFAAGHLRTPRAILPKQVTPSIIGSLIVHFMHDEENNYGLNVHNQRGRYWMSYGDGYYFSDENRETGVILKEALQASVDEIFYAYTTGKMPSRSFATEYLPIPNELSLPRKHDITPLFYWDEKKKTLYRRQDISNPYDTNMTSDWWGWTTLILLAHYKGLPIEHQANIALAGYGELGIHYGVITDRDVIDYVRAKGKDKK